MEFYTSYSEKRPIRLSDETRSFAFESLNFKYGSDTLKTPNVSLNHIENYKNMSDIEKYNAAVYEIAVNAPVRICENELISGAATLGDAIKHMLPAKYDNDENNPLVGVSHFTADFYDVLEIGMNGLRKKAEISLKKHNDERKIQFLKSCIHCIDCMKIWHERYLEKPSGMRGYENNIKNLKRVPFDGATNFYEAVQSIWFCFAFMRLCGCWPGIGRIDVLLGKYLKNDIEKGVITLDEAREILAHFFIKGCEWITGEPTVSGDAQHYQNLVLSGIDEDGRDVTNDVTYLVLDIIEETGISDFPTTVRINKNTDDKLLNRISEVIRYGGGVIAVYNEDLILESLADIGYEWDEAVKFANDGCWEVQIPGKTWFSYTPFDGLKLFQSITLKNYSEDIRFDCFEEMIGCFENNLRDEVGAIFKNEVMSRYNKNGERSGPPCTVVSLFEKPCIENGMSYFDDGTEYVVVSPHIGGLPDVVNSLYAIKKAVFDEKIISFNDFMRILRNNWENEDVLRNHMLNGYSYYGNDNDEADEIAVRILSSFSEMCREYNGRTKVKFISGVSTFGRQIEWAESRMSTPSGKKKGEVLSGNMSPSPGTDKNGVLSAIKSYCKADLKKQHSGAALDVRIMSSDFKGENAIAVISALIKSFVELGGFFMQIDTVSKEILKEAQKNPEMYRTLSVRVSGWNARFVTLSEEWQDMIIYR